MTVKELKLAQANGTLNKVYGQEVTKLIRNTYSSSDELAILRKKLNGTDNGEFDTYNSYVEECKAQVKSQFKELGFEV